MAKTAWKSFSRNIFSQKPPFSPVLMYFLYGHPRYFKVKRKYQQNGPVFWLSFRFLWICLKFTSLFWIPSCIYHEDTELFYKLTNEVFNIYVYIESYFDMHSRVLWLQIWDFQFESQKKKEKKLGVKVIKWSAIAFLFESWWNLKQFTLLQWAPVTYSRTD